MPLRDLFLLDPDVVFLNHGSFGATPRPVFEVYQEWQRRLERQPVRFFQRELMNELCVARAALGAYLNAPADDLAFVPNATAAVNIVARSLRIEPGDEILTTDHEYGACDNVWDLVAGRAKAKVVRRPVALPVPTQDAILEEIWSGVTARTKLIFASHITSPTALRLPVEALCRRAREAGILTMIDGAHGPGQIPLDLTALEADFYTGNCHKWLCAPKSAGFLYVRRDLQQELVPYVVSWGIGENNPFDNGSRFLDNLQWPGTIDQSAYLSVPAAIAFQREHDWDAVRESSHALVRRAIAGIAEITGLPPIYPADAGASAGGRDAPRFYHQMAAAPLPPVGDIRAFQDRLYERGVEIPCLVWNGRPYIRVSIQGYNTEADVEALWVALRAILPRQ
jgi:isopenicillin-N epimerase